MSRSRRVRTLLVPLAVLAVLLVPALAFADEDDAAQPKRVKIEIAKKDAGSAPQADPMHLLHEWLRGHLFTGMTSQERQVVRVLKARVG